jgi:hypothetical protein
LVRILKIYFQPISSKTFKYTDASIQNNRRCTVHVCKNITPEQPFQNAFHSHGIISTYDLLTWVLKISEILQNSICRKPSIVKRWHKIYTTTSEWFVQLMSSENVLKDFYGLLINLESVKELKRSWGNFSLFCLDSMRSTFSAKSSQLCGDKVSLSDRPWMSSYIMQCVSWLRTVFWPSSDPGLATFLESWTGGELDIASCRYSSI